MVAIARTPHRDHKFTFGHWTRLLSELAFIVLVVPGAASAQQIKNAIPEVARPLPLSAVRLTGGPLKRAQDLDAQYLLKLEPDRMMAYYRKRAGLEPRAQGYGGWDGDGKAHETDERLKVENLYKMSRIYAHVLYRLATLS